MFVYFDNSATTKTFLEVNEKMFKMQEEVFGNPSSLHKLGIDSENIIKDSRKIIAKSINANEDEIIFTSGGTEGNNLCIRGFLERNKRLGKTIITDSVEHSSVASQFSYLKEQGYNVKIINVTKENGFSYDELYSAIDDDTALVSVMYVNNETGEIFDIERIREIIRSKNKNTVLHCDCVQAYMKIPIDVKKLKVDMITLSSHKINGPKGVGAVYIKKGINVSPLLIGGGQEMGIRNGTENTVGIYGFSVAVKKHYEEFETLNIRLREIKEFLYEGIKNIEGTVINTNMERSAPHILNVSFSGIRSEIVLHTLESSKIYVSSGSACSSNDLKKKKILEVMGEDKRIYDSAIRISLGYFNTMDEAEYALNEIKREITLLRKRLKINA